VAELEELVRTSRCENLIRFLGSREDVPVLLRAADLFVLPSRYEGCSNATLEAMASGLPVLACDVGGMREIVTQNRTGWLVRPGDGEGLVHTLLGALLDRCVRHRVGTAGRDAAVKYFGVDTWVARHTALYRRLAGLRPLRTSVGGIIAWQGASMCGIAGVVRFDGLRPDERACGLRMASHLRHRGPDDVGGYCDAWASLGHARLSIIDPEGGPSAHGQRGRQHSGRLQRRDLQPS
jgi:hypothetical protein